ncbi:TVP38/TMEM64 family protein [Aureibacter tunicatorum]|uniref:TVP38/TMEM64 family membrane protein n=1 Tax=Aureibacter tunicatorum TaxID=866807 RepID=A0AAE3XN35_9BACT|nr:VTT domain-containing protein [Aureibacter tunicatorum]MDR6239540.1 putative membrane protein YdjX (TVP38/TMEM64 family) [Aureibacter tunicatorum]BDD04017.1 hypothetical protein AUTU_15000 [Aureibacter tunicatorum]
MKKWLTTALAILTFILASFILVESLDIQFLKNPDYLQSSNGLIAFGWGTLLLSLDIILPVPSTVILIANGAIFGTALGAAISMLDLMISTSFGILIGSKFTEKTNQWLNEKEKLQAEQFISKWGLIAIIISRSIPMLSETILLMAAAMGLNPRKLAIASFFGYLPGVIIYAYTGAFAATLESSLWSFIAVISISSIFWLFSYFTKSEKAASKQI